MDCCTRSSFCSGILFEHPNGHGTKVRNYWERMSCNMLSIWQMGHLLYGKSDISVKTDHQPLKTIFKKPLYKAPRRLQAMRLRLPRWSFFVKYIKGAHEVIANTLSRAPQPQLSAANLSGEHTFRVELETTTLDNSGISNGTLKNLREQTAEAVLPHNDRLANWQNENWFP